MNLSRVNLSQIRYPQYMALNDGLGILIAMGSTPTSSRKNREDGHEGFRSSIVKNFDVLQTNRTAMTEGMSEQINGTSQN